MPESPLIRVSIEPETRSVRPGEEAAFIITVENASGEAQAQTVDLTGLPDAWYKLTYDTDERAFPGEKRSGNLLITVPEHINGGTYDFDVSVMSGSAETSVAASVEVVSSTPRLEEFPAEPEPAEEPPAEEQPKAAEAVAPNVTLESGLIIWRGQGQSPERKMLYIRNPGTEEADYVVDLEGLEPGWYTVQRSVRLGPGQEFQTDLTIHPPAGARQQDYPFRVAVSVAGQPSARSEASGWLSLSGPAGATPQPSPAPSQPQPSPEPAEPAARPRPPQVEGISPPDVVLSPRSNFRFGADEPVAQALVTVHNRSRVRERYRLVVTGIPEDWYRLSDDEVRLDPGENVQVSLRLSPITGPGLPAGEYEFVLRAVPDGMPEYFGEALGVLSISGVARFDARLEPLQAEGTRKTFTVRVSNAGDVPLNLSLEASDPEGRCKYKLPPPRELGPGQDAYLPLRVGARRNGIVGAPETFDFRVRVKTEESDVQSARDTFDGRFVHHPRIPYRAVFLTGFFCALVGFVFLLVWLLSPAFSDAATWVGCQLDSDYRLSSDTPALKKEECGGNPRDDELDEWQRERQESARTRSPDRLSPAALVWPDDSAIDWRAA